MTISLRALLGATALLTLSGAAFAETTITVATVNNGVVLIGLSFQIEWIQLKDARLDWTHERLDQIATNAKHFELK